MTLQGAREWYLQRPPEFPARALMWESRAQLPSCCGPKSGFWLQGYHPLLSGHLAFSAAYFLLLSLLVSAQCNFWGGGVVRIEGALFRISVIYNEPKTALKSLFYLGSHCFTAGSRSECLSHHAATVSNPLREEAEGL